MIKLNKVIKTLIISDFFLQSGWGLIGPIFAIFITQQIKGGTIQTVGLAAMMYWIIKSIVQPFISSLFDKNHGEKDDFLFLVIGMYVSNLVPFAYIFTTQIWQIFALEILRGLAMACVVPNWSGIFTRHIDKGKEAFSWSMESTGIGFATGFAGALGAWIASVVGFKFVFILVSLFGVSATTILLMIKDSLFLKDHSQETPIIEKPI